MVAQQGFQDVTLPSPGEGFHGADGNSLADYNTGIPGKIQIRKGVYIKGIVFFDIKAEPLLLPLQMNPLLWEPPDKDFSQFSRGKSQQLRSDLFPQSGIVDPLSLEDVIHKEHIGPLLVENILEKILIIVDLTSLIPKGLGKQIVLFLHPFQIGNIIKQHLRKVLGG